MERIEGGTWRTDNGDTIEAHGLRLTVEFGEKTRAEVLGAVEAVRTENAKLRELVCGIERAREALCDERRHVGLSCNDDCPASLMCAPLHERRRELGIEVKMA